MIETLLNEAQAKKLYDQESFLYGSGAFIDSPPSGVPLYRIGELFGLEMLDWIERDRDLGSKSTGKHFGLVGSGSKGDPIFNVVYLPEFLIIVCRHNRMITSEMQEASEAGKHLENLIAIRLAKLAAEDAEEERKREERRAKRAAARKKKQESEGKACAS